ncbi:type II secretion system protein [Gimesia maris]|nr:prepilin-type N-terminal cleavage/methylation domain-containing protein [Gimesia maris]|tara:strand:+ start:70031 stop:71104 length:1074 start_codon:yes stop_codon:yes gene_type:complete
MRRLQTHQDIRTRRDGFTIVELMMVVAILLFLIATSAFVVRNIGNKAREKATMANIIKVNGLLSQRIQAFQKLLESKRSDKLIQPRLSSKRGQLVAELGNKKYYSLTDPVIEILVRKDLFRENFPQFIGDSKRINSDMDIKAGVSPGTAGSLGTDGGISISSEYLYFVLTQYDGLGIAPIGEDAFNASEVADTDGDGLKEFVDGWGRPLRFYHWPSRLFRPFGSGIRRDVAGAFYDGLPPLPTSSSERDPLAVDPDDPLGRLDNENSRSNGLVQTLFNDSASYYYDTDPLTVFPCEYGVLDTYSQPLIVSAGEDGILGLYEPHDFVNNGVLAQPTAVPPEEGVFDNITNHNQRAGGR